MRIGLMAVVRPSYVAKFDNAAFKVHRHDKDFKSPH